MTVFETVYLIWQGLALISWIALPIGLWRIKKPFVKTWFLIAVMFINVGLGIAFWYDQRPVPAPNNQILSGDFWDIETIFQTETNVASRAWKRNILTELQTNLNQYRQSQNLPKVVSGVVESFSPQQLYRLRNANPEAVQLLDVREAFERDGYRLADSMGFRYGDLANNLIPSLDPEKKVVVVCYSGIRGYLVANLLRDQGFQQPGFIRGGLESWHEASLPALGNYDDFTFLPQVYDRFSEAKARQPDVLKIDFRATVEPSDLRFPNTKNFNGELATSAQVESFIESLNQKPVVLLCETESECYDARMFAYNYEAAGGSILGYYQF